MNSRECTKICPDLQELKKVENLKTQTNLLTTTDNFRLTANLVVSSNLFILKLINCKIVRILLPKEKQIRLRTRLCVKKKIHSARAFVCYDENSISTKEVRLGKAETLSFVKTFWLVITAMLFKPKLLPYTRH